MDIEDLVDKQGWNDDTLLTIVIDFIHHEGLYRSLVSYAADVARQENEQ